MRLMGPLASTALCTSLGLSALFCASVAQATQATFKDGLQNVNHIIVVMQENHSFDNYFGALAFAPNSPYHAPAGKAACKADDHQCVDGLTSCQVRESGQITCTNKNLDDDQTFVTAFHDGNRCVAPDLDHSWLGTHKEVNFNNPNSALAKAPNDGFVQVNDATEQVDSAGESPNGDETMGFYNQSDLPFYYDLARKFAISDRHFASVLGPTFPNRSYSLAATSFGHLTTSDSFAPPGSGGYKPLTGTIFDLMEANGVSWDDYFEDVPAGGSFRNFSAQAVDPHFLPHSVLLAQLAGLTSLGGHPLPPLAQVIFVDPNFGVLNPKVENDEHPPTDIQRGQADVAQLVNAFRNGPFWKDSILFITYDEHGGFYDHVKPPMAKQASARTPDGIAPGQCADASNLPASGQPGRGAECSSNLLSQTDTTVADAEALCPALTANPTGPYPAACASFDQLGVRVPFVAVSPFAKPAYVSHVQADHTSVLALIEKRFMTSNGTHRPHLTARDGSAETMEDMFDFVNAPSANTTVGTAQPPANDCSPTPTGSATP